MAKIAELQENVSFAILNEHVEENVIFSPVTIRGLITLLYVGSGGKTADELKNILRVKEHEKKDDIARVLHNLLQIPQTENFKFINRNHIVFDKTIGIKESFKEFAKSKFNCQMTAVKFDDTPATVAIINNWLSDSTNAKIQNLYERFLPKTQMICVNVAHFDAKWKNEFTRLPMKQVFHTLKERKIFVNMMIQKGSFRYGNFDSLNASAILIPYTESDTFMLIVLPKKPNGIDQLERKMRKTNLDDILKKLQMKDNMQIVLPLFQTFYKPSLKAILQDLHLKSIFTKTSDLRDMLEHDTFLPIADIMHVCLINVNETRTDIMSRDINAAPTTPDIEKNLSKISGIKLTEYDSKNISIEFNAVHPFFFAILLKNHVYFKGHLSKFEEDAKKLTFAK